VLDTVANTISPINDVRGSREYRMKMAEFLVRKLLAELSDTFKKGRA